MKKLVNGEIVEMTQEELDVFNSELTAKEQELEQNAPYNELEKLDAELPRWAEDMATAIGLSLKGRAEAVRLQKVSARSVIQAREQHEA